MFELIGLFIQLFFTIVYVLFLILLPILIVLGICFIGAVIIMIPIWLLINVTRLVLLFSLKRNSNNDKKILERIGRG